MKVLKITLLVALVFGSSTAALASYFIVPFNTSSIDFQKRTDVIISGRGNDLGYLPQIADVEKARRIAAVYPNEQIVLIMTRENAGDRSYLEQLGLTNIQLVQRLLDSRELMNELTKFSQIASLHVYGHSAIPEGLFLDRYPSGRDVRWYPDDEQAARLAGHFTQDAIATLNGCNAGHIMAPILSRMWGIPVSGALSGTHFESIFSDGYYYMESHNNLRGLRMRPDDADYNGMYGHYHLGLPFYKFFCVGFSQSKCLAGMAKNILTTVSNYPISAKPTLAQYEVVTQEWLCPVGEFGSPAFQRQCMATLGQLDLAHLGANSPERYYSPFSGVTAQCNFQTCYTNSVCSDYHRTMSCAESSPSYTRSTTFVDEYINYLRGFEVMFPAGNAQVAAR